MKYVMRRFVCSECGNVLTAAKSANKKTAEGHIKDMWCPMCKKICKFVQTSDY